MRLDAAATLVILLSATTATSAVHHHGNSHERKTHGSRGERLLRDVRLALRSLISPDRTVEETASHELVRRGAGPDGNGQCVLLAPNVQKPGTTTTATAHRSTTQTTPTMAGGPTPTAGSKTTATSSPSSSSTLTSPATHKGSSTSTSTSTSASPTSSWVKKFDASGSNFFDNWTFFTGADPTNGAVVFQNEGEAKSNNLTAIDSNGYAIMRVETTPTVTNTRMSVRIESSTMFTGGLWVMDATHMPVGCGTWPAFWTHGPNWPQGGEIDILEGVNSNTLNQATLHTTSGCNISPNSGYTGSLVNNNLACYSQGATTGCGLVSQSSNGYGDDFNSNNGGVYTMLWDDDGVSVWFFPRNSIPSDITSQVPDPSNWGTPFANWAASGCAPFQFNQQHVTIFDTTLCGDWAGGAWAAASNGGGPSCQQSTGVATCQQYIQSNGAALSEAYWKVKSVRIYQTS